MLSESERNRLQGIDSWITKLNAQSIPLQDAKWLIEKLKAADESLRKWEMICERDHGKPPGRFQDVVEEMDGRVTELKVLLRECLNHTPIGSGLELEVCEALDLEPTPMRIGVYRAKGSGPKGGDLG